MLKGFDLNKYIYKYHKDYGIIKVLDVPEEIIEEMKQDFTFYVTFSSYTIKANIHNVKGRVLTLKDYNHKVNFAKIKHY